ncbi:nucleotidyl transferase AbiEii/AbiGii toxin family protein [bacterium]|nr:nucleotidyl transferase AbiEii/AbiGii toxin family protein [bacterium]
MKRHSYFHHLYLLQDQVAAIINDVETSFYLTGGTALSRGYLNHRFSDDLDFFVNDDPSFNLYLDRIINQLISIPMLKPDVVMRAERYAQLAIENGTVLLKLEFVNDVPSHIGAIVNHPILGRLDSAENILANKVTAILSREEPKDLADIWGICSKLTLSLQQAITNAEGKAAGIFPADLARVLLSATKLDWEVINWIDAPKAESFVSDLHQLGEDLIVLK